MLARIPGTQDHVSHLVKDLVTKYTRTADHGGLIVGVGGYSAVFHEVGTTIEHDLVRAESLALPDHPDPAAARVRHARVVVAAPGHRRAVGRRHVRGPPAAQHGHRGLDLQPQPHHRHGPRAGHRLLAVRGVAVPRGAAGRLRAATSRWPAPCAPPAARWPSARSTVAASLCALLVFPLAFLRSFAYAGVAVAFLAGMFSVVVLPALLAVLGRKVDALTIFKRSTEAHDEGFWHRMAIFVMRRPVVDRGERDRRPADPRPAVPPHQHRPARRPRAAEGRASSREVHDTIRSDFGSQEAGAENVVAVGIGDPATRTKDIAALRRHAGAAARRVPGRRQHRHVLRRRPGDRLPLHAGRARGPGRTGPVPRLRQREGRRQHVPLRGARRRAPVGEGRGAGQGHPRAPTAPFKVR